MPMLGALYLDAFTRRGTKADADEKILEAAGRIIAVTSLTSKRITG